MQIISILLSVLALAALIGIVVLWIMSLYHAATSQHAEIKDSRAIWILLIVFTGIIGSIVFFFVDGKKREGIWLIVATLALPLSLVLMAVTTFMVQGMRSGFELDEGTVREIQLRLDEEGDSEELPSEFPSRN